MSQDFPEFAFAYMRQDFDEFRHESHFMHSIPRSTSSFRVGLWNCVNREHRGQERSPFMTMHETFAHAAQRKKLLNKQSEATQEAGYFVRLNVWECEMYSRLLPEDVINLSTRRQQLNYFQEPVHVMGLMELNRSQMLKEIYVCWKGELVMYEHMELLSDFGDLLGPLRTFLRCDDGFFRGNRIRSQSS